MVRRYPLDPENNPRDIQSNTVRRRPGSEGLGAQLAQAAASALLAILDLRYRRPNLVHLLTASVLTLVGISLVSGAALTDKYLHRGVETGFEEPYVVQPSGRELATNVDLRLFTSEDITSVAATMGDAGFGYVRQEFTWAEIEPAPGEYDWEIYDLIVSALNAQGIEVVAVIVDAPAWSLGGDTVISNSRPPQDPGDLNQFANELTSRYGHRVPYVQVWDRPNLASQWGGRPATGETFLPYLTAGFNGARAGNPEVRIVTPELARNPDVLEGLGDLAFLESLYANDATDVFDIVGISLDGGQFSPDDRRVSPDRTNFSRAILTRELMLQHDDGASPVWATTYGWAAGSNVTRVEQAEYVVRGLERAWSEWPWMGLMIQWQFATVEGDPNAPRAIAPAGESTPLYRRLSDPDLSRRADLANTGFAPMDADAITYQGNWEDQHLEGRTFRTTNQVGSSTTIRFQGTGLIAFLRSGPQSGPFRLELDGEVIPGGYEGDDSLWSYYISYRTDDLPRRLISNLDDTEHTVRLTLMEPGELVLGGFVVERQPPFTWPVILLTISSMLVLFLGVRSFIYLVGIRCGRLQRKEDATTPSLPRMPDWRPDRRV